MPIRSLLLAVSITLWMQSVVATQPASPVSTDRTQSCMTKWIQVFDPSISNNTASEYEEFLLQALKPIDETNAASSPIWGLLLLGGRSRAEGFVSCLSARTPEKCQTQSPCQHSGKCVFSSKSGVGAGHRAYVCACQEGFSGEFCQTALSGCAGRLCQNGGACQSLRSGRFKCVCRPHFSGRLCEREWFTEQMLEELVSSVDSNTKAVKKQVQRFTASRTVDWKRTADFLRDMENRLVTKTRGMEARLVAKTRDLEVRLEKKIDDRLANATANVATPVSQQNSVNLAACTGWVYKGVCLKSSIIKSENDSIPSGCNAYKPSTGWAKSDYIAICTHFGGSSNCPSVDIDLHGGLCTNYVAILSYENYANPDVWAAAPTFSWNPSLVASPLCNLFSHKPTTAVYACR